MEPLLDVKETAAFLKVPQRRVYDLIQQQKLAAVRVGRTIRVSRAALEAFIERGGAPLKTEGVE